MVKIKMATSLSLQGFPSVAKCGPTAVKRLFILYSVFLPDIDEGVFINTDGDTFKDVILQWGELPTSVGKCNSVSPRPLPHNPNP